MSDYSQEEIRLLDEFAARWLQGEVSNGKCIAPFSKWAENSYDAAAAMIAERRKRVPQPQPGTLYYMGQPIGRADQFGTSPVAQPEPEKGELTEENIAEWEAEARSSYQVNADRYILINREITRAVALMREGLRYRQTAEVLRHKVADLQRTVEQGADDLRAADESITIAKRERDEARAEAASLKAQRAEDLLRIEQAETSRDHYRAAFHSRGDVINAVRTAFHPMLSFHGGQTTLCYADVKAVWDALDALADRRRAEKGAS